MAEATAVWEPFRRALVKAGIIHFQRLEDSVTPGIPDVNVHIPGCGDWWIEMKDAGESGRRAPKVNVGLSFEQRNWLRTANKGGRDVALLARIGGTWLLLLTSAKWDLAIKPVPYKELAEGEIEHDRPDAVVITLRQEAERRRKRLKRP